MSVNWLSVTKKGLYCSAGNFYIDPSHAVDFALITHGHGDHARTGHQHVLATPYTLAIMATRYGEKFAQHQQAMPYGVKLKHQQVDLTFFPAGHILGSAQILLEYNSQRVVISGDYKRKPDPTCEPFTVIPCDIFISEATFGLPVFTHPPIKDELQKLLDSLKNFPERTHVIGVYALGKCQRVIAELRRNGYVEPIYLHGALTKLCKLYQKLGINLGELESVTPENKNLLAGKIVLAPPGMIQERWTKKLPEPKIGIASGWMRIRARAKQKLIELPLIISDHADWHELMQTFEEVNAKINWITHGNEEALIHALQSQGKIAQPLTILASTTQ